MNRSNIREFVRALLSEPTAGFWSDVELNNYIDYGYKEFCRTTLMVDDIDTFSTVAYQGDYTLASDVINLKRVELVKSNSLYALQPVDMSEFYQGTVRSTSNQPWGYNFWDGVLRLTQRITSAAASTTLSSALTSSGTTASIASTSNLPKEGRVIIDSEVIGYTNLTTNTSLNNCTRALEGTVAASHLNGVTVTLRNLYCYINIYGATLSGDSDSPDLPIPFHQALAFYAAYVGRNKSKDWDLAKENLGEFKRLVFEGTAFVKHRWKHKVYQSK